METNDLHVRMKAMRGAASAVARALGISRAAVSKWRAAGIPATRREAVAQVLDAFAAERAAELQRLRGEAKS